MTQPPAGYGQPPSSQYGYGTQLAEHPQAGTVQILGIVGIFVGIVPFIAWYLGSKAKQEIEAGAPYVWEGRLKTGYLLGKVFSIITLVGSALSVIVLILILVFGAAASGIS